MIAEIIKTAFYLLPLFDLSYSRILNCEYETSDWAAVGPVYYCKVLRQLFILSPLDSIINSLEGTHQENMTNEEVLGFYSFNSYVRYFPNKLEQHFPNLEAVWINYGRIVEIHQSDLKPLTKLVRLDLGENDISVLEEGLFDLNPDLKFVSFVKNKICKISPNIFDNLVNLAYLELSNNDCFSMGTLESTTGVKNIIRRLKNIINDPKLLKDNDNREEVPLHIIKNANLSRLDETISNTTESVILDDDDDTTLSIFEKQNNSENIEDSSGSGQEAEDQNIYEKIRIQYMKMHISNLESSLLEFPSGIPELPDKFNAVDQLKNLSKNLVDFLLKHGIETRKIEKIYVRCHRPRGMKWLR